MSEEFKQRLWSIVLKEYNAHVSSPEWRKKSWLLRLEKLGIKLEEGEIPGHIVVGKGNLAFGDINIPVDLAEKILVLGVFP